MFNIFYNKMSNICRVVMKKPILPVFILNWIFGLGIIEYPIGKQRRMISFLYSAISLIIYCSLAVYGFPHMMMMASKFQLNQKIMIILFYFHICLTIITVILGLQRSKGMRLIAEQTAVADTVLEKLGISTNHGKVFKRNVGKTIGFLILIIIMITISSLPLNLPDTLRAGELAALTIMYYPIILMFIVDSTFINTVEFVHRKFKKLNDVLKKLLTSSRDCPQHRKVVQIYLNRNKASHNRIPDITQDVTYIIHVAKEAHLELVKICREADHCFGLHALLSIGVSVSIVTGILYHIYALIAFSKTFGNKLCRVLANAGSWFICYIIKLYALTYYCSAVSKVSVATGDIITEIYDESFSNDEIQLEIRDFHMQLIRNSIKINVYGFVPLDFTLIRQVISSIVTYLFILVQFGNLMYSSYQDTTQTANKAKIHGATIVARQTATMM